MGTYGSRAFIVSIGLLLAAMGVPGVLLADSLKDIECYGAATHRFNSYKPAGATYKVVEHYCLLENNSKRRGATKISIYEYEDMSLSIYIYGQYGDDQPVGRWVIIDFFGDELASCVFKKGVLKSGSDELCEKLL